LSKRHWVLKHPLQAEACSTQERTFEQAGTLVAMQLRIEHLSKRYSNGVQALNDVSLTIGAGMFGLLGPNGAGKSTLMRILATLQEADSGEAFLDDIDILREKDRLRRVLGYLPQEFGVYPKVTAGRLLDHFAELKGITEKRQRHGLVDSLLRQTNLWDARNQRLGGFSGGMKQRFGIAVALIGDPKLIIVDEPTAGLDPEERVRFHNLLSEIGEHVIVILSTHIVSDVSDLCQSMAIIHLGRVLVQGHPVELARALRGRIWQKLIARAELAAYKEKLPVISSRLVTGKTLIRVHGDSAPETDFEAVEPDLEDLYFWTVTQKDPATLAAAGVES
jgi:ABC-type multidrug transport system ATPase subunit